MQLARQVSSSPKLLLVQLASALDMKKRSPSDEVRPLTERDQKIVFRRPVRPEAVPKLSKQRPSDFDRRMAASDANRLHGGLPQAGIYDNPPRSDAAHGHHKAVSSEEFALWLESFSALSERVRTLEDRMMAISGQFQRYYDHAQAAHTELERYRNDAKLLLRQEAQERGSLSSIIQTISENVRLLKQQVREARQGLAQNEHDIQHETKAITRMNAMCTSLQKDIRERITKCENVIRQLADDFRGQKELNHSVRANRLKDVTETRDAIQEINTRMQSFQTHLDQVHKVHADAMQQMEGTMRTLLDATTSHRSQATNELRSAISQIKGWSQEENARVVSQLTKRISSFQSSEAAWRNELQEKISDHNQLLQAKLQEEHVARTHLEEKLLSQMGELRAMHRKAFDRFDNEFADRVSKVEQTVSAMAVALDQKREVLRAELKREILAIEKAIVVL